MWNQKLIVKDPKTWKRFQEKRRKPVKKETSNNIRVFFRG
jgi:hypothetical protein